MARKYDQEYKVQAVKLAKEIGGTKAAKELGIPEGTVRSWKNRYNWDCNVAKEKHNVAKTKKNKKQNQKEPSVDEVSSIIAVSYTHLTLPTT